jgi:hypothetical protein
MKKFFFPLLIITLTFPISATRHYRQQNYEMSIKAVSIPVFAVDRKGQPVHDLKKDEIKVLLNGKEIDFYLNKRIYANSAVESIKDDQSGSRPRLIYICFDTIFNNRLGIKKGKQLAKNLILSSNNTDKFVLLQFSIKQGISLIGGPLQKSLKLLSLIDNVHPIDALNPDKFFSNKLEFSEEHGLFDARDIENLQTYAGESQTPVSNQLVRAENQMKNLSSNSYNILIKTYSSILTRMEYILKTISQPKLVFLLSYGMNLKGEVVTRSKSLKNREKTNEEDTVDKTSVSKQKKEKIQQTTRVFSQIFKKYIDEIALAINNGGSMLFTVNPLDSVAGSASLKSMAEESGGKYYHRQNIKKIVKEIHRDISAYYEISFQLEENIKNPIKIEYLCDRKGVRLKSIKSLKKISEFHTLSLLQKKTYLLDSFINNQWQKYFKGSKLIPFKEKLIKNNEYEYLIPLENLGVIGKNIETYLVSTEPGEFKYEFDISSKIAGKSITIKLRKEKGWLYFFVIVNLKDSICYYNKI